MRVTRRSATLRGMTTTLLAEPTGAAAEAPLETIIFPSGQRHDVLAVDAC